MIKSYQLEYLNTLKISPYLANMKEQNSDIAIFI